MITKDSSVWTRLWEGVFGKRAPSIEELIEHYRLVARTAKEKCADLTYDLKIAQRKYDRVLLEVTKNANLEVLSAAGELQGAGGEIAMINTVLLQMQKSQYLADRIVFRLKKASDKDIGKVVDGIRALSQNEDIKNLLTGADIKIEEFEETVDREFDKAFSMDSIRSREDESSLRDLAEVLRELRAAVQDNDQSRISTLQAEVARRTVSCAGAEPLKRDPFEL